MTLPVWSFVLIVVGCLLGGAAGGFAGGMFFFRYQQKKNPPINEAMIRAMFAQMGRKASEAQVRAVMNSVNNAGPKKAKKTK